MPRPRLPTSPAGPDAAARPPHPATTVQPRHVIGGLPQRAPHPATVAQPKAPIVGTGARPPHPATAPAGAPHRATGGIAALPIQRSRANCAAAAPSSSSSSSSAAASGPGSAPAAASGPGGGAGGYSRKLLDHLAKRPAAEKAAELKKLAGQVYVDALKAAGVSPQGRVLLEAKIHEGAFMEALKGLQGALDAYDGTDGKWLDVAGFINAVFQLVATAWRRISHPVAGPHVSTHNMPSAADLSLWQNKLAVAAASFGPSSLPKINEIVSGLRDKSLKLKKIPDAGAPWATTESGAHIYCSATGQITKIEPPGQASMTKSSKK